MTHAVETTHRGSLSIDFLYSEDCPSHERALALVRDVLSAEGLENPLIAIRRIDSEEQAQRYAFPGSPTIRVNGADIVDASNLQIGLSCRAYRQDDGRISPLPPRSAIVQAVRSARTSASRAAGAQ